MERKTTQRIIGMLVIVALVIILLPLLFGKNEIATATASVKVAPPLPESQPAQVAEKKAPQVINYTPPNEEQPEIIIGSNGRILPPAEDKSHVQLAQNTVNEGPSLLNPNQINRAESLLQENSEPASADSISPVAADNSTNEESPVIQETQAEDVTAVKEKAVIQEVKPIHEKKASVKVASHSKEKHLAAAIKSGWAVQMGSFRNKENAKRLADKLRAAGYKTVVREVKSASSGNVSTQVFIGPEFQQASAVKLSNQVEQEMNLRGIVVSLKQS